PSNTAPPILNTHPMTTHRENNITKPKPKLNLTANLTPKYPPEPRTVNQPLRDKIWRASMSSKLDAFARNQTYDLVPRPQHKNVVGCRWIYKNKFLFNGSHRR